MRNDLEHTRWDPPANRDVNEGTLDRHASYAVAEAWAEETVRELKNSRRFSWMVALALIVVCGAQAAAIAIMLPLKQIVPFTILVDKTTGYLEMVHGVRTGDLPQDQVVVQSLLAQYVLARETFDAADLSERYKQVVLWSDGPARADYVAAFQPGAAPIDPASKTTVAIKEVEIVSRSLAHVRFRTDRRDASGADIAADSQATIGFRFSGAPMRMEDRLINPLGFQAISYRRDVETPFLAQPAAAVTSPVAAPFAAPALQKPATPAGAVQIAPPQATEP